MRTQALILRAGFSSLCLITHRISWDTRSRDFRSCRRRTEFLIFDFFWSFHCLPSSLTVSLAAAVSLRYQFTFTDSSSWLCHCQLYKTLYGSHMYLDPSAPNYACQQMEHATWFSALLHSSKTGLMTYQRKLRGDKWHRSCIGGKWKHRWLLLYGVQVTCVGGWEHYICLCGSVCDLLILQNT